MFRIEYRLSAEEGGGSLSLVFTKRSEITLDRSLVNNAEGHGENNRTIEGCLEGQLCIAGLRSSLQLHGAAWDKSFAEDRPTPWRAHRVDLGTFKHKHTASGCQRLFGGIEIEF